jgi:signal transduction histidine kinase
MNLSLIEHLAVGVYLCDSEGKVVAFNSKAAEIWGEAPRLETHQKKFCGAHKLLTPDGVHVPHDETPLAQVLVDGKGIVDMPVIVERQDGSRVPVLANVVPLFDEDGRMLGFVNSVQDMSQKIQLDLERGDLEDALRQARKMEIVGQLTSGLAHDFNNHLAALTAVLGLMRREVEAATSEKLQTRYGIAVDALERATGLAQDLMAFARNRPRIRSVIKLDASLNRVRRLMSSYVGANINQTFKVPQDLWTFEANSEQFESVILNLVLNAKDAMPHGGEIVISGANLVLTEWFGRGASSFAPGEYVRISFSDDGQGIPPSVVDRIFTPFFTTKDATGTGLGLAMVNGFVVELNGQIEVRSVLGEGTTFDLYLPRLQPADV